MNCSVSLFGDFGSGYTQYPSDSTQNIFQKFYANSSEHTQITVHRNGNLMYYGYVQKLDVENDESPKYIGICIEFNGIIINNIKELFTIFESSINNLVVNGDILHFRDNGDVISDVNKLYQHKEEIERISEFIRNSILKLSRESKALPPISYGIANDETKSFSIEEEDVLIAEATGKYSYTFIYKPQDYDTHSLSNFRNVIRRLFREKEEMTNNYNELSQNFKRVQQQKKQYRNIFFLCLLIVAGIIGLLSLNDNLNNTKRENVHLNEKIGDLNSTIDTKDVQINGLESSLNSAINEKKVIEEKINKIADFNPCIITNLKVGNSDGENNMETEYGSNIYSSNTMYLRPKILYIPLSSKSITVYVKLFRPNGELSTGTSSPAGFSTTASITINSSGEAELGGWGNKNRGNWPAGTYRYEIWYDGRILFSKSFQVY